MDQIHEPPFSTTRQLCADLDDVDYLPGFPYISVHDKPQVKQFVHRELCSDTLDAMAGKLWWMSKQDSRNIAPLHRQLVKRRNIVVSEDPKLHLVWIEDRIFVKPLPRYLLSHTFWKRYLVCLGGNASDTDTRTHAAALGFLRSYVRLIRYESDFRIAQEAGLSLVPSNITWKQFCDFTVEVARIPDDDVSERFRYGEIRLTRLNFYAPFLIRRSSFQRVHYQYSAYFTRFYGPILFTMAIFSLVLSGFQVLSSMPENMDSVDTRAIYRAGLIVSVGLILATVLISLYLWSLVVFKVAREWRVALHDRHLRLLEDGKAKAVH